MGGSGREEEGEKKKKLAGSFGVFLADLEAPPSEPAEAKTKQNGGKGSPRGRVEFLERSEKLGFSGPDRLYFPPPPSIGRGDWTERTRTWETEEGKRRAGFFLQERWL